MQNFFTTDNSEDPNADVTMESVWIALDLRMQNPESADPRDGSFVMIRSPTTFGNKR